MGVIVKDEVWNGWNEAIAARRTRRGQYNTAYLNWLRGAGCRPEWIVRELYIL